MSLYTDADAGVRIGVVVNELVVFVRLKTSIPFINLQAMLGLFHFNMNKIYYMMITTALLIPLVYIKSLKMLGEEEYQFLLTFCEVQFVSGFLNTKFTLLISAPFSLLANVINVIGLIIILQYCVRDLPPVSTFPCICILVNSTTLFWNSNLRIRRNRRGEFHWSDPNIIMTKQLC